MKRDGQAEYQRHQGYVPVRSLARVQEMIAERQTVAVVLGVIAAAKVKRYMGSLRRMERSEG